MDPNNYQPTEADKSCKCKNGFFGRCKEAGNPNKDQQFYKCKTCDVFKWLNGWIWIPFDRTADQQAEREKRAKAWKSKNDDLEEKHGENYDRLLDEIGENTRRLERVEFALTSLTKLFKESAERAQKRRAEETPISKGKEEEEEELEDEPASQPPPKKTAASKQSAAPNPKGKK